MTGTFVNAAGIIIGGVIGIAATRRPSLATQKVWKLFLGLGTLFIGLRICWLSIHGPFSNGAKQVLIAAIALVVGHLLGRALNLQRFSNYLGRQATQRMPATSQEAPPGFNDAFLAGTILFCVNPIGILGAIQDGLLGEWWILGVKAVMDGLATLTFARTMGWGVVLSAIPVTAVLGSITLLCHGFGTVSDSAVPDSVALISGLMVFSVALVILEAKKVELANYLPCLLVAPLLTWFWG